LRPALISAFGALLIVINVDKIRNSIERFPFITAFVFFLFNILFINFHFSWPAYLLAAMAGLLSSVKGKKFFILAASAFAGILINPLGVSLFSHILFTVNESAGLIYEWNHVWDAPIYFIPIIFSLIPAYFLRNKIELQKWSYGTLVFSLMGIWAIRFAPWALLFSIPCWTAILGSIEINEKTEKPFLVFIFICNIILAVIYCPRTLESIKLHGLPVYTSELILLPRNCNLLASQLDSNSVLLFRPDVKIMIDGRNDYWGKDAYIKINRNLLALPEPFYPNTNCALIENNSPLSKIFSQSPQWKKLSSENAFREIWSSPASLKLDM
jgi:hypothetical protein